MSLGKRLWRVTRGLGRKLGEGRSHREPTPRETTPLDAAAEAAARAEVEALEREPVAFPDWTPPAKPQTQPQAQPQPPAPRPAPDPAVKETLATHYAALGVPVGASLEQIERAYQHRKAQLAPQQGATDPLAQARARQQDARLDEAYYALRQALTRERRL